MTFETLDYVCKSTSLLWSIPFHLYQNDKLLKHYDHYGYDFDFTAQVIEKLKQTDKYINIMLSPQLLMYAMIKVKNSKYTIIVGPSKSVEIEDAGIRKLIINYKLPLASFQKAKEYFELINITPVEKFYLQVTAMNAQINDEVVEIDSFNKDAIPYDINADIFQEVTDYMDSIEEESYSSIPYSIFEQKMLYFIKTGQDEKLLEHLKQGYKGRPTSLAFDAIRQYKDRGISMTTLVSRAAMEGGLNKDVAYKLFDLYCSKIEKENDINKLNLVIGSMLLDYVKRVKETHFGQTENPTINRTVEYINRHVNTKLSASSIAKSLNINAGYLSVRFKRSIGVSLPEYINQQKIKEAKNLLKFTNRSLVDIADFLSYSSQCYFQKVFKRYAHITPYKYRVDNQNNID